MPKTYDEPDYRTLFRELPGRYIIIAPDAPTFTIVEVSDFTLQILGGKRSDLLGRPFKEALRHRSEDVYKLPVEVLCKSMRKVMRTKRRTVVHTFRYDLDTPSGKKQLRYWQLTQRPVLDSRGELKYIVQSSTDITEEINIETKLQKAEAYLSETLMAGLIGVWSWDIQQDKLTFDKVLAEVGGFSAAQAKRGIPISEMLKTVHSDDRERVSELLANAVMNNAPVEDEYRLSDEIGPNRWFLLRGHTTSDAKGVPRMLTGVIIDISARKRAQAELQLQTKRVAAIADSLPIMLYASTEAGIITYYNEYWHNYTGASRRMLLHKEWTKFIHPKDIAAVREAWQEGFTTGNSFTFEQRIKRHDGTYRWHLGHVSPIRDDSGKLLTWFGSNIDIEELKRSSIRQKRLEQVADALKEQRRELVSLNKAKDEFISLASHQLRTPATAVKQYLGLFLEGYLGHLTKTQMSALQTAYDSNERQLETVNDLLRVAQADAGKVVLQKEKIDIAKLLCQVISEQKDKFDKKKQKLIMKNCDKPLFVVADELRIRMVLDNLIDNASKYTYEGKTVRIGCTEHENAAEIYVADEGVGIDSRALPRLFQKFSRIENPLSTQAGGTGLGLYWAYKIVELHNGKLEVESEQDVGTRFTILLPK